MTNPENPNQSPLYEPIDGLYDAMERYTIESIVDGSTSPEDLVHTAYALAGRSTIGCASDFDLILLAQEEIETLRRECGQYE